MKTTQDSNGAVLAPSTVRKSPSQRFETGLMMAISDPILRLKIRRLWEKEMQGCTVFWEAAEKQLELISDTFEVIIRERTLDEMWGGYSKVNTVLPNRTRSRAPARERRR